MHRRRRRGQKAFYPIVRPLDVTRPIYTETGPGYVWCRTCENLLHCVLAAQLSTLTYLEQANSDVEM